MPRPRPPEDGDAPRWDLIANVSLLFNELPLRDRPMAAARAGFQGIEMWWPFPGPVPTSTQVNALTAAIDDAGIPLRALNLWAGYPDLGERGILSDPDRYDDFHRNLDATVVIAERTGCRLFNALHGNRRTDVGVDQQHSAAISNLSAAAVAFGAIGGTVLIEPLSPDPTDPDASYPVSTAAQAVKIMEQVRAAGGDNIGFLYDTFHLATNGESLRGVIASCAPWIAHVQLADAPGRGAPGSGAVDFLDVLTTLGDYGYAGLVACEYVSDAPTGETLAWVSALPGIRLAEPRHLV